MSFERRAIATVGPRFIEEAAHQFGVRSALLDAPHVRLHQLRRMDDRLAAFLDGATTIKHLSGRADAPVLPVSSGEFFVATFQSVESQDLPLFDRLLAAAEADDDARCGLLAALAWRSPASLRNLIRNLLAGPPGFRRGVGLMTCAAHGVDPGAALGAMLRDLNLADRAFVLVALGRQDLIDGCAPEMPDDEIHAVDSACARVLLGDRRKALDALLAVTGAGGDPSGRALMLVLKLVAGDQASRLLGALNAGPRGERMAVRGVGALGDPRFVPWLVERMAIPRLARCAGEAFSLVTGVDLALSDLEGPSPDQVEAGPNDDPADDDVALDEDEGLPWPDAQRIGQWWAANMHLFAPGQRYFLGASPTPAHCERVLRTGRQRQRVMAADWLCLLRPGTTRFNTAAPAWRQQRRLAA